MAANQAEIIATIADKGIEWQMQELEALQEASRGRLRECRRLSQLASDGALREKAEGLAAWYAIDRSSVEVAFGYPSEARQWAKEAARVSQHENPWAALFLARAGDPVDAQTLADELAKRSPKDTLMNELNLPMIRAALAISHGDGVAGEIALRPAQLYSKTGVESVYLRGLAYRASKRGKEAATEFQQVIDRRGNFPLWIEHAIAPLGLARAYAMEGDTSASRKVYQDFFAMWKDADPDIPLLKQAKAEYAKLR